jgi:hypothetical protein
MIKMIAGVYGRKMPDGTVKPMNKDSGPFWVTAEQEERLIRLGLAVRVDDVGTDAPIGFDETPPEDDGEPDLPDGVVGIPEYSTKNTKAELMEIGELCGISLDAGMTKVQMVAALDAHIDANTVNGVDIDDDAAEDDGEPAPTFDASEAVL